MEQGKSRQRSLLCLVREVVLLNGTSLSNKIIIVRLLCEGIYSNFLRDFLLGLVPFKFWSARHVESPKFRTNIEAKTQESHSVALRSWEA